ncbi:hypothetical protein BO71DRAFT_395356 [Aspergillus ellipticus CBS 707.79]|uniref:Uncharacterized protein n=1 Tax=Aspergillus ellipticus CBS 707.79 TaxID=1448320 RepID=A0A319DP37_9EURO|nr:hypothetical protein BO71DRAFT_395356 [Aspergillus ellipticus CBS 707.79]
MSQPRLLPKPSSMGPKFSHPPRPPAGGDWPAFRSPSVGQILARDERGYLGAESAVADTWQTQLTALHDIKTKNRRPGPQHPRLAEGKGAPIWTGLRWTGRPLSNGNAPRPMKSAVLTGAPPRPRTLPALVFPLIYLSWAMELLPIFALDMMHSVPLLPRRVILSDHAIPARVIRALRVVMHEPESSTINRDLGNASLALCSRLGGSA